MANHPCFSHNNPWAHSAICCDQHHGESTSAATARLAGNISVSHDQNIHNRHLEYHDPSACNSECPLDTYCCSGDYCCDKHGSCSSGDECCDNPSCEEAQRPDSRASHHSHRSHSKTEQSHNRSHQQPMSLEEWAVTQEGCDAIQQLIECCNQPDCHIPVCPTDNSEVHPPPADPLSALFASLDTQQQPQPISTAQQPMAPVSSIEASHTCHWGNCHLVFGSMPDLLAHVAADHLNAAGTAHQSDQLLQQPNPAQPTPLTMLTQRVLPSISTSSTGLQNNLQINSSLQVTSLAVNDALLSCMWDDCFPVPDVPAASSTSHNMFHQYNSESSQAAHNQQHDHTNAAGEPFSPGTMLRHVLEEHLGIPPDIIGWPNEAELQAQAQAILEKHHHHHHIGLHQALANHSENCNHVHPHPHPHSHSHGANAGDSHLHGHGHAHSHFNAHPYSRERSHAHPRSLSHSRPLSHEPLPTPPSTVKTEVSTSPDASNDSVPSTVLAPSQPAKSLICLWPGCTIHTPFADTTSLMDHLSEVHIPKGKDCYTCHWDGCGGEEGRMFKSRQKVLRHLQSHIGHKPFVCGRTHNGEKPFVCPYCEKGFVEASNLTKHIRTHTGERPFACSHPGCGKKFSRPDQLKRHMTIHNKASAEKRRGSGVSLK
ncbi:specific RNA polymerase II transcription factor [Cryptococcus deuterogattii 2001/935-1]|nr:specific RNA polymerase II transcription factor [Cryptococcus deuterogattii 2001/935-1]